MNKIRTRYAPSPTGHLHIGNAVSAITNFLFTRKNNGTFVIRIEDTDTKRNISGGEKSQLDNLKWLGVDWDESIDKEGDFGPYYQSQRIDIYNKYVNSLIDDNRAYRCFCTSEELENEKEVAVSLGLAYKYSGKCKHLSEDEINKNISDGRDFSVRFSVPQNEEVRFTDEIRGIIKFETDNIGDFVILKKDGIPTYNFANVIDDHLMEISHVIRGEDHISNTPKQVLIYNSLNFELPKFIHTSLIVNEDRKKLSKRDGHIIQFIEQYKELGYLPEAILNFISLLAFTPKTNNEILSIEELISEFTLDGMSGSPSVFDLPKLRWINEQHMKRITDQRYFDIVIPFVDKKFKEGNDLKWIEEVILLFKNQLTCGSEINDLISFFFKRPELSSESQEIIEKIESKNLVSSFQNKYDNLTEKNAEEISRIIKECGNELNLKGKDLFMPIRINYTGQMHGPDLAKTIMLILGKND